MMEKGGLPRNEAGEGPGIRNASSGTSGPGFLNTAKLAPVMIWFTTSIPPISTNRSPFVGSTPVVSVSRTISRIANPPSRQRRNRPYQTFGLHARFVQGAVGVDHNMRAATLLAIRHLARYYRFEFRAVGALARERPRALDLRSGADHDDEIKGPVPTRFKQ